MRTMRVGVLAGVVLALGLSSARAGLLYNYSFDQNNYNVGLNGTVNVSVYLNESGAAGDAFILAPSGSGLVGTGVRLNYVSTAQAKVLSGSDITGNSDFDNGGFGIATDVDTSVATAGFTQSTFFNPPVHGTASGALSYQLFLGTFTFTAGATPGVFAISTSRFNSGENNVIDGSGSSLDSLISDTTATITVGSFSAVPEPSSFVIAATGSVFALGFAWRKRNR